MNAVAARVNSALLPKYTNRLVRIVGTLIGNMSILTSGLEGNRAVMETSDKGQVVIHTVPGSALTQPGVYEVIAKVIDASQVQEVESLAFEGQFGKGNRLKIRCGWL